MEQAVPIIFTPPVEPLSVSLSARAFALAMAGAAIAVLVTAVMIQPSPSGMGTHQKLGFQRCEWLATSGIPCMTCGMTTSFTHFVRGNWLASFYVQPMGFVAALMTASAFWAGSYVALTGRPIQRLLREVPMVKLFMAMMFFAAAAWGWKIFIFLRGMDGWQ